MEKRVAIVVCAWPPMGGGIGNNAYYHLKWLIKSGVTAEAFTPDYGQKKEVSELPVNYLKTVLPLGKAGFMFGLLKELKRFDIIHLYYPFFGSDFIIWLFKKINPQKKLVLHYEMDPIGQGIMKIFFWLHIKLFLGAMINVSDRVGVLSFDHCKGSYLADFFEKQPDKFLEISNGIEADFFSPSDKKEDLLVVNNFSVHDKIIIFVGGLDDQHFFKGVPVLLESFATVSNKHPEAKLLVVGDGNLKLKFKELAKSLNLESKVSFVGWVNNDVLPDYYRLADIFVLPSTESTESFGIVVAEAQACGLPAVVSDWPGVRSTLADGQTGLLVRPKDARDLSDKLIQLLSDEDLCHSFGQAGRGRAAALYDWSELIKRIISLYEEL
ncbi:MAG: Mannosylfructose-phosphate synthase [Parcubacteria group bacterium ADurb.Bin326]|nr:MAG: Mannosylfructose-phosphate synthase [Parcubacteria group bacterium ADurb.Bin326]